jgi:hypothetical protein
LSFKPGIVRDVTSYSNTGGWSDGNLVRFRNGFPESFRGWQKYTTDTFEPYCRSLIRFSDLSSNIYTGLGTTCHYYIEHGGTITDITPIRQTYTNISDIFTTTNGSASVLITFPSGHNANVGDIIIISDATDVGGILAATLNTEHEIATVPGSTTVTIVVGSAATSDAVGGGASTDVQFLYWCGTNAVVFGTGWGADTWGRGTWGSAATVTAGDGESTRVWTHDNFGEDLIICPRNGPPFYWDATSPTSRATFLSAAGGASDVPLYVVKIIVSEQDRHVIALGCNEAGSSVQDFMLVRWSDQEDAADWTPTTTNSSGSLRLSSGSKIITGIQTKDEVLIFTDASIYSMQYIGGVLVFGFNLIANNIHIAGINAVATIGDVVYWMGDNEFYKYDGRVQRLNCPVEEYIFADIDGGNLDKVFAAHNTSETEIIWFYQSMDADEPDKYVIYNFSEDDWYYGTLARTAYLDDSLGNAPLATGGDGYIYSHETGDYDGSSGSGTMLDAWIKSGPLEIGEGDEFIFMDRFIPDLDFLDSSSADPEVDITITAQNYPGLAEHSTQSKTAVLDSVGPPQLFTNKRNIRLRGRAFSFKIATSENNTRWRLGTPRVDIRNDGQK